MSGLFPVEVPSTRLSSFMSIGLIDLYAFDINDTSSDRRFFISRK